MSRRGRWVPPRCSSPRHAGRVAYRTMGRAIHAIEIQQITDQQAVAPLEIRQRQVYQCPACRAWFLSTRPAV